jgi:hypothetical protein
LVFVPPTIVGFDLDGGPGEARVPSPSKHGQPSVDPNPIELHPVVGFR